MNGLFLVLYLSVITSAAAQASDNAIGGILTKVQPSIIEVQTDSGKTTQLTLNPDTTYRKWIMAKPWQQDANADVSFLKLGTRVRVDVTKNNSSTAQRVWIVVR